MRIATWNLEHDSKDRKGRINLQIQRMKKLNPMPDIFVLTETRREVDLTEEGYTGIFTEAIKPTEICRYERHCSAIWTKFPITKHHKTYDRETAICVEVETPLGNIVIYSTIITWRDDKGPNEDSPPWLEHHREIFRHGDDWYKLRREIGNNTPFLVCGDFNQTRDGSNAYCSKGGQSILMLDEQLKRNDMICLTEEDFGKKKKLSTAPNKSYPRNNIDHICATQGAFIVANVGAWDHFDESGTLLSDHNGVFVDLAQPSATDGRG